MKLAGSLVALATPLKSNRFDVEAYRALIHTQLTNGTAGLVPVGSTGEAATLSDAEQRLAIETAVAEAKGQVPVIAGAGTNCTDTTIAAVARARDCGADAALVVTPYYNKPTQAGLFEHFRAIANAHPGFPIVAYNVPGRTGCDLLPETTERLCEIPEIVGLKDATGNLTRHVDILERCGTERLSLLSGDDFTIAPYIAMGGHGVISVSANIVPLQVAQLVAASLAGERRRAAELQILLNPLHRLLFCEANPIPVKWALHRMGLFTDEIRLPLTPLGEPNRSKLAAALKALGVAVS